MKHNNLRRISIVNSGIFGGGKSFFLLDMPFNTDELSRRISEHKARQHLVWMQADDKNVSPYRQSV
jgi:hypothetical protein